MTGVSDYPGSSVGLPETGAGSLASWGSRIGALVLDWGACMVLAIGMFGTRVLTGQGWPAFMILAVFFVESTLLTITMGGSFGQLIARIGIIRHDLAFRHHFTAADDLPIARVSLNQALFFVVGQMAHHRTPFSDRVPARSFA